MSDESEYDPEPEEFDIYKRKYQLLLEKCEILQQVKFEVSIVSYKITNIFDRTFFFENVCFLNRRKMRDWSTEFKK